MESIDASDELPRNSIMDCNCQMMHEISMEKENPHLTDLLTSLRAEDEN